jgi:hypothetical protein
MEKKKILDCESVSTWDELKDVHVYDLIHPETLSVELKHSNVEDAIKFLNEYDYKEDLEQLYRQFSNQSDLDLINRSIAVLINPLENNCNEVISRINRKIKNAVGDSLYDFYCIKGERGEKKMIKLDREMIVWV